jgi:RNA-binding protein
VTESVQRELDLSLKHHELMKVKISSGDRKTRSKIIQQLCDTARAELVQAIGHIALIYRPRKDRD